MTSSFDRVRPRRPDGQPGPASAEARPDREGKRALYTPLDEPPPARGAVSVACPQCGETSVLGLLATVRAGTPGLHVPVLRRGAPSTRSFMRCPACRVRSWLRITLRV